MHKVSGIGGFFFRASDSDALNRWYSDNLGIDLVPESYGEESWKQEAGETVFTAMPPEAMEQFAAPGRQWVINFRVPDLDGIAEQLRASGTEVTIDPETYPNGRFASLVDPEGNPIQLWQPEDVGSAE